MLTARILLRVRERGYSIPDAPSAFYSMPPREKIKESVDGVVQVQHLNCCVEREFVVGEVER